jgi:pyruvate kinase
VKRPHRIVGALRAIIEADPEAIVASRLFDSLAEDPIPSAADIGDAAFLLGLGYRTFLLGDAVCLRRDSVLAALNVLEAVAGEMDQER